MMWLLLGTFPTGWCCKQGSLWKSRTIRLIQTSWESNHVGQSYLWFEERRTRLFVHVRFAFVCFNQNCVASTFVCRKCICVTCCAWYSERLEQYKDTNVAWRMCFGANNQLEVLLSKPVWRLWLVFFIFVAVPGLLIALFRWPNIAFFNFVS